MEKPFVIYRSSAGSGKTYTLALEYLKLALRQPNAYRSILAVTFTNKATQEMKGRVLEYLHQVAATDDSLIRQVLAKELDLSGVEVSLQAQQVLAHLLHGYSYFSVMTIDAFFQKVVRGFAREMGLQAGFKIELDIDSVLDDVLDRLMLEIGDKQNREIRRWLTRFAEEKVEEGSSWDFRREIKVLAKELFKEEYRDKLNSFQGKITTQSTTALLKKLRELQSAFEEHMTTIGQAALGVLDQHQADVADFSYGKSGVVGYFDKITTSNHYTPTSRVLAGRVSIEGWVKKSDPRRENLLTIAEALHPHLVDAIEAYEEYGPLYHSVVQMQRFIYAYGILHYLEEQIDVYKRENDLMLISDAPVFLQNIIGKDDTPFIYEKIGSYYQHFLIDEFQDTSGLQWLNFRPLVENSLDAGQKNLVVGDVKQSIYRWRGGDWQLLLETIEQDIQSWRTEIRQLDANFRSRKNILEFNNALFRTAPDILFHHLTAELEEITNQQLQEKLMNQAKVLQQAYQDVAQKLPTNYEHASGWHGHVKIELLDEDYCLDEEGQPTSWRSFVKSRLPSMVEDLQAEGYAAKDIAFLVRDKRDGQAVVDTFMQYKHEGKTKQEFNYEVVSSESLILTSSMCVNLIVELLRFLDNSQDQIVISSILSKYNQLQQDQIKSDELHQLFSVELDEDKKIDLSAFFQQLPSEFEKYYRYLNKLPIYELVENLILIFELGQYSEKAYLQAFQDAILQYSLTEQGDLRSFLGWWDEKGKSHSAQISEETDAMRVMTIHKAKGLQFKIIIIPFCDWPLDHRPFQTNILWAFPQDESLENTGLIPMRYSSRLTQTIFSQEYYEEKIRIHMDHLNLLYVAFTRAEEGLYAFARPNERGKGKYPINGVANLLRNIFPEMDLDKIGDLSGWDEMGQVFEVGSRKLKSKDRDREVVKLKTELSEYASVRWRNRLSIRPLSKGFFGDTVGNVSKAILMQQLLIQLRTTENLENQLEKIAFERGLTLKEKQQLKEQAITFLSKEEVSEWYRNGQRVLIQRPLRLLSQPTVVLDRVIIDEEGIIAINFYTQWDESEKTKALISAAQYLIQHYQKVRLFLVNIHFLEIKPVATENITIAAAKQSE